MPRSARPGKKGLYVEIPEELYRLLDERAVEERRPKTTTVIIALEQYLGVGPAALDSKPASKGKGGKV
jgi:hypothetical protein